MTAAVAANGPPPSTRPINLALYRLLIDHGASAAEADEAARLDTTDLVTQADLALALARLKADLLEALVHPATTALRGRAPVRTLSGPRLLWAALGLFALGALVVWLWAVWL